jgi:endonuclease/exonuclease/phosphatase (EEP) superfamily protein YafD
VNLHLDARSSWRRIYRSFGTGRVGQMRWLLAALGDDARCAVLGGDFNSWAGGAEEPVLRMPEERGFVRGTPLRESTWNLRWFLGILDHVFYRLPAGAAVETRELAAAYGSDHRPWLGWVQLAPK